MIDITCNNNLTDITKKVIIFIHSWVCEYIIIPLFITLLGSFIWDRLKRRKPDPKMVSIVINYQEFNPILESIEQALLKNGVKQIPNAAQVLMNDDNFVQSMIILAVKNLNKETDEYSELINYLDENYRHLIINIDGFLSEFQATIYSFPAFLKKVQTLRSSRVQASFKYVTGHRNVSNVHAFIPELATFCVIGAFSENKSGDIEAISAFTDYKKLRDSLLTIVTDENSLVEITEGVWKLKDRKQAWDSFISRITDSDLKDLESLMIMVLGERDPALDLSPDQHWCANIYGKKRIYSEQLRDSLTETLVFLGVWPELLARCSGRLRDIYAANIVYRLLKDADGERWTSIQSLAPRLAEAAPEVFLDQIEDAIRRKTPIGYLFSQESTGFTGRTYMSGILWALELIAWEPRFLQRVTLVLGHLAALDTGGGWTNRPSNSLATIFMPWLPQTLASVEERYQAVNGLVKELPDMGYNLLLNITPNVPQMSMGSYRPEWRINLPDDDALRSSQEDYRKQLSYYATILVNLAHHDLEKSLEITKKLRQLPPEAVNGFLEGLADFEVMSANDRDALWMALAEIEPTKSNSPGEIWLASAEGKAALQKAKDVFSSRSLAVKYAPLFDYRAADRSQDEEVKSSLAVERRKAIEDIINQEGYPGILDLAEKAKWFQLILQPIPEQHLITLRSFLLSHLQDIKENPRQQEFTQSILELNIEKEGWTWVDELLQSDSSPEDKIGVMILLPFDHSTWEKVEKLQSEHSDWYWRNVPVNQYRIHMQRGCDLVLQRLLKVGRPGEALACVTWMFACFSVGAKKPLPHYDSSLVLKAFQDYLQYQNKEVQLESSRIKVTLECLEKNPEVDRVALLRIEYAYSPILIGVYDDVPKLVSQELAMNPGFFLEVFHIACPLKNENLSKEELTAVEAASEHAWNILRHWQRVPGTQLDGTFSTADFTDWLASVKQVITDPQNLIWFEFILGNVLIFSPPDPSGLWIHKSIAEVLDALESDHLRCEYDCALTNHRGSNVVDGTGSFNDNHARELEVKVKQTLKAGYPRLAALLERKAKSDRQEAEDERQGRE